MIAIPINFGIVHVAESKATCPTCETPILFSKIDAKWQRSKTGHIRHRCEVCQNSCMITQDIIGDFVAYLPTPEPKQIYQ